MSRRTDPSWAVVVYALQAAYLVLACAAIVWLLATLTEAAS